MTIRQVIRDVGRALSHLHQYYILHRDVKCDNIMVNDDGQFMLIDLELAMHLMSDWAYFNDNDIAGTKGYIAPEMKN